MCVRWREGDVLCVLAKIQNITTQPQLPHCGTQKADAIHTSFVPKMCNVEYSSLICLTNFFDRYSKTLMSDVFLMSHPEYIWIVSWKLNGSHLNFPIGAISLVCVCNILYVN